MRVPFRAGGMVRSMAGVGTAALAGQALTFAMAPLLTRLYSQEAFGQLGLMVGLTNVLAVVALFGLNGAVFAPSDHREALALLRAGLLALGAALLPSAAVAWCLSHFDWFGYGALPEWLAVLVPLHVAGIGAMTLLQPWLARRQGYRALARSHVTLAALRAGGQVGLGAARMGLLGITGGEILARLGAAAVMARAVSADLGDALRLHGDEMRAAVRRRSHFVLYGTATNIANNVGTAIPPVLVTLVYGVAATGTFTLTTMVLTAPIALVQKAVGDVFLGHFAARYRSDRRAAIRLLYRVAGVLALLGGLAGLVLMLGAEPLFALVFGESWRQAGALAAILAPLFVADFIIGSVSGVISVADRPQGKLLFDGLRIGGMLLSFWLARARGLPLEGMIALFAWTGVLAYAVYASLILWTVRGPAAPSAGPPMAPVSPVTTSDSDLRS